MPSCFGSRRRPVTFKWPWKKTPKRQPQFLGLPREIRDIIYHLILPSGKRRRDGTLISISIDANTYRPRRRKSSEKGATKVTAILCTCRQVYLEASDILYKNQSFRYDPPYMDPILLMPYGICSNQQRAGSSSTRLAVTHLPYASIPLSTVARFELMEVFSSMAHGSWYRSGYNPTIVFELLAKYATNLKLLLIRLDHIAFRMDRFEPFVYLIARLPYLLNSIAKLKSIDLRADVAGRTGRKVMGILGRCAKATAELDTWAFSDLSSVEMNNERTPMREPTGLTYRGRWLLRK